MKVVSCCALLASTGGEPMSGLVGLESDGLLSGLPGSDSGSGSFSGPESLMNASVAPCDIVSEAAGPEPRAASEKSRFVEQEKVHAKAPLRYTVAGMSSEEEKEPRIAQGDGRKGKRRARPTHRSREVGPTNKQTQTDRATDRPLALRKTLSLSRSGPHSARPSTQRPSRESCARVPYPSEIEA
jgi:hypothetical protein